MKVAKVEGNCSMLTISDNPCRENDKHQFILSLNEAIRRYNTERHTCRIDRSAVKSVQMTTNYRFGYGFMKRAYSYKGNSSKKARVLYMNFPNGFEAYLNKKPWWKKISISIKFN